MTEQKIRILHPLKKAISIEMAFFSVLFDVLMKAGVQLLFNFPESLLQRCDNLSGTSESLFLGSDKLSGRAESLFLGSDKLSGRAESLFLGSDKLSAQFIAKSALCL